MLRIVTLDVRVVFSLANWFRTGILAMFNAWLPCDGGRNVDQFCRRRAAIVERYSFVIVEKTILSICWLTITTASQKRTLNLYQRGNPNLSKETLSFRKVSSSKGGGNNGKIKSIN